MPDIAIGRFDYKGKIFTKEMPIFWQAPEKPFPFVCNKNTFSIINGTNEFL
jgi:hypothetical protein